MKRVIDLGIADAIDTIQYEENVYCKSGVWNKYELTNTAKAIEMIKHSGYGADVYFDEKTEKYYVSIPCDSDMW